MQQNTLLTTAERAVRARVCPQCSDRLPSSGSWSPTHPRPCEPECPIFLNLSTLLDIVEQNADPSILVYERAVQELICLKCDKSPTAGDFCGERTTQHCPLSRYLCLVVDALERVVPQKL